MKPKTNALLTTIALVLILIFAQVMSQMVVVAWQAVEAADEGRQLDATVITDNPQWTGTAMLVGYVVLCILLWGTKLIRRNLLPKCTPPMPRRWGWTLVAFFAIAFAMSFIADPLALDDGGSGKLFEAMKSDPACLALLVSVGPLTEELVFREGIQRTLTHGGFSPTTALITSALLFAVVHGNLAQALPAFTLGILLGILYQHTGDIRLSLIAHVLNNGIAVIGLHFPQLQKATDTFPPLASLACGTILAAAGSGLLWWSCRHNANEVPKTEEPQT